MKKFLVGHMEREREIIRVYSWPSKYLIYYPTLREITAALGEGALVQKENAERQERTGNFAQINE